MKDLEETMGSNETVSKADTVAPMQNVTKLSDYQTLDMTGSQAYKTAKASNDAALANYTEAAMGSATKQGLENIYGSENSYGAIGAGGSGAAQAAQARGMAAPIAQANQQIAGLSAEQNSKLISDYTGVVAPTYQAGTSDAEVAMMNKELKSS
jgi:hypothetical protein